MAVIYKGFASGLAALNRTAFEPCSTLQFNGSRTYMLKGRPCLGSVHFENMGESFSAHERIQRHFLRRKYAKGRIYAGAAGEANIVNLLASLAPGAVLIDDNALQTLFWENFLGNAAECEEGERFVDSMQDFAGRFYYQLADILKEKIREQGYMGPPGRSHCSPFRGMNYSSFPDWFNARVNREYIVLPQLNWVKDKALYNRLHLMAKYKAIGALTLDICDAQGCRQFRQFLDDVTYIPVNTRTGAESKIRRGADIGMLYLSNIFYFMNHSEKEKAKAAISGETLGDFYGRTLQENAIEAAMDNLRPLVSGDALILRFDRACNGTFYPPFDTDSINDMRIPRPLEKGGLVVDIA